jgi:hypothetical protein
VFYFFVSGGSIGFWAQAQKVAPNTAKAHLIRMHEHFVYIGTNILSVTE